MLFYLPASVHIFLERVKRVYTFLGGSPSLRTLITIFAACILFCTPVMGSNQLYTGDATTVPVDTVQLQVYQDTTPSRNYRIAGSAATLGVTSSTDIRLAYGYLWNNQGPDSTIGPNIGFKWRMVGNGVTNPSVAVSTLYAINNGAGGAGKGDYGALLILSYPTRPVTFLANFGRVWIGDPKPDLYFIGLAAVHYLSRKTLLAIEYSDLIRIGSSPLGDIDGQYAIGTVYRADKIWSYGLQLGYLPNNPSTRFHTTISVSAYL